jgi:hypothetical protein
MANPYSMYVPQAVYPQQLSMGGGSSIFAGYPQYPSGYSQQSTSPMSAIASLGLLAGLFALLHKGSKSSAPSQEASQQAEAAQADNPLENPAIGHWELSDKNNPNSQLRFVQDVKGHYELSNPKDRKSAAIFVEDKEPPKEEVKKEEPKKEVKKAPAKTSTGSNPPAPHKNTTPADNAKAKEEANKPPKLASNWVESNPKPVNQVKNWVEKDTGVSPDVPFVLDPTGKLVANVPPAAPTYTGATEDKIAKVLQEAKKTANFANNKVESNQKPVNQVKTEAEKDAGVSPDVPILLDPTARFVANVPPAAPTYAGATEDKIAKVLQEGSKKQS